MSYAAINDVTRGIRQLLHSQLVRISPTAVVSLLPPGDVLPEVSGVNLYLYRAAESAFTRNRPWPGDRTTAPSKQPALGLQLHYLLTPLGTRPNDASFSEGDDSHTMLGVAMLTLHENAVLNDVHLPALPASGGLGESPGFDAEAVLPSYLLNSYDQIKIMLSPVGTEELSKIWATINQPYRLSVAYEVSLVQIVPTPPPAMNGGIVMRTGLDVITLMAPVIDALDPAQGALQHLDNTGALQPNSLLISGGGFDFPGQAPAVTIGGRAVPTVVASPPAADSLIVNLPADLDAGPQVDVRVALNGRASTPLPFTVSPWLSTVTPLRTDLPVGQKLTLRGVGFTTSPQGVRFDGAGAAAGRTAFDPGVTDQQGTITVPSGLPNGIYQLRVVLGDASRSVSNSRTLEVIPRIDSVLLTPSSPPGSQALTVSGARLDGSDIRLAVDGITYRAAPNADPAQLVYAFGRMLDPGSHRLSVSIDGHLSHGVNLEA
jgi:Pvc16 N-terminal domain